MQKMIQFHWLAAWLLLGSAALGRGAEPILNYGTGDWPVKELGNVRARLRVSEPATAVWAHVPWRRRDTGPEANDTILVDASTGQQLTNVVRVTISREAGDLLFQTVTAPGEYYLYYLPYRTAGEWYFPSTIYLASTNRADAAWAAAQAAAVQQIKEGHTPEIPRATVLEIQAINDFHRFDPMEITAPAADLAATGPRDITISLAEIGLARTAKVRDLWNHKDLGAVTDKFTQAINSHGAGLYRFQPQS